MHLGEIAKDFGSDQTARLSYFFPINPHIDPGMQKLKKKQSLNQETLKNSYLILRFLSYFT